MIRKGQAGDGAARLAGFADLLPHAEAPVWLDPEVAADIRFTATVDALPALRQAIAGRMAAPPPSMSCCSRARIAARRFSSPTWIRP